jgi:hypothetical protein
LPVSQAGWRGKTFLIRMRLVQGEGASGPPVILQNKERLFVSQSLHRCFVFVI